MHCSIQHCSKCVIALWFSVWGEEIAQMTAKSQQQRWWELWVQEQKKHRETQTCWRMSWRSWSNGKTSIFSFSNSDEIKPGWLDSHLRGRCDISSLCDSVLEWSDAIVWVTVAISCLAKGLQAMTSGNFHLSPTESVLQRSGCYQVVVTGAELHRHCGSRGCYKPTEQSVQLRLDLHV